MKIAILIGSSRTGRQSHKIAYYLETQIRRRRVATDIIDLGKRRTVVCGDAPESSPCSVEEVPDISARVQEADALIFVTPEYHGSFSGILKNTLDNLGTEFYRKPIGVVTVSSGKMGGINASTQLQHVVLSLGAFALPNKLLVPEVTTAFDDFSQLINEKIIKAADKFLEDYIWFADALYEKKHNTLASTSIQK
jgi:NAD(P)H-dependent FMN reductase